MARIYLAVLQGYNPDAAAVETLYYSSGDGFVSRPSDTPANTYFAPRLVQPFSFRRDAFAPGATIGSGGGGVVGDLVLNNADGGLDHILDWGFDGRELTLYQGEEGAAFPGGFNEVASVTMEQPEWDHRRVTIRVRDWKHDARARPVQETLYAGNNALPDGVEGTRDDLEGKPKPLLLGPVLNAPARLVNTSRLVGQIHDGALQSIQGVYVKGAAKTLGTAHATLAALAGATVAAGTYDTWLGGGMIRLAPGEWDGTVTVDATEGATAADRTAGQIWRRLLERTGTPPGDIDTAAVAALDAAAPAEVGIYIHDPRKLGEVLDDIAQSAGAWWGQNRNGLYTIQQLTAPSGTPVATYTAPDLLRLERISAADPGARLPVWRVIINYARNWFVQTAEDLDPATPADRRAWLDQEFRSTSSQNAATRTRHLLAPSLTINTLLVSHADASAEAARQRALREVHRDRYELRAPIQGGTFPDLGEVVRIQYRRFGLAAGRDFRVIGVEPDIARGFVTLTVWG